MGAIASRLCESLDNGSGMIEDGIYENVKADVEENRKAGHCQQTRHDCTQFGANR
jgi:hypothetical protein